MFLRVKTLKPTLKPISTTIMSDPSKGSLAYIIEGYGKIFIAGFAKLDLNQELFVTIDNTQPCANYDVMVAIGSDCILQKVNIAVGPNDKVSIGARTKLYKVSIKGSLTIGDDCDYGNTSFRLPKTSLHYNSEAITIGKGSGGKSSYVKDRIGENTILEGVNTVNAPVGKNLIIPLNRTVYEPIPDAAVMTRVDDALLDVMRLQDGG